MIILTSATPFLKTLLTTTETPTHISDFRNLPRSDSRANKPDIFPGFDFLDETTTLRPRTPLDFYTKVIGGIVNQGRQTYERIVNNIQQFEINRRTNLKRNSDLKLEATTESVAESTVMLDDGKDKSSKGQNWPKKYFSSIIASVALNKLRNATDPEYFSKMIGTSSATYINPLLDVWKRATMKLKFVRDTTSQQHQYENMSTVSNNTYLPSMPSLHQLNDSIETNPVSNPSSSSLGFRFAFSKYLNLISKGYGNDDDNDDDDDANKKTISEHSELSGGVGGVPWGDVNLNNNHTMGVDDVDFPIERIDERKDDDVDGIEDSDDDDESNENGNLDAGNFGIFILEIFGTIAGLTWGAFSQIQSLFAQNGK